LHCPICQSERIKKLYDLKKISGKEFELLKCKNCRVKFLNPLPSLSYQKEYYNDTLYKDSKYFVHMKKDYRDSQEYRIFERGIFLFNDLLTANSRLQEATARRGYSLQRDRSAGIKGKVLDIGCSSGVFLDMMKTRGWDVAGVELCSGFVNMARELFGLESIFNGTLEEARFENKSFDLITMWDLIEHVPNTLSLLKEVERILRPNGLLLILTPSEDSLIKYLTNISYRITLGYFKLPISVIYDEHHLFYFNPGSLDYVLKSAGFKTITRRKEATILDRIIGPDSDHWLKNNKLITFTTRLLFSLSNILCLQNKMLVIAKKIEF